MSTVGNAPCLSRTEDHHRCLLTIIKPLFYEVYRLCENERRTDIRSSSDYVAVDPASGSNSDVVVELRLGYGEQDREQKMLCYTNVLQRVIATNVFVQNRYQ